MAQAGALLVDGAPAPKILAGRPTFGGAPEHIRMLDDGIDFDVLNALPVDYGARGWRRPDHASWPVLGAPVPLASAEFAGSVNAELETNTLATLTGAGELNAFMLFFESHLTDRVSLSTDPRLPAAEFPGNWRTPVWLVPPIGVCPGEKVRVAFSWRERGAHRWDVCRAAEKPE